jgi:hypothetical protein
MLHVRTFVRGGGPDRGAADASCRAFTPSREHTALPGEKLGGDRMSKPGRAPAVALIRAKIGVTPGHR